MNRSHKTYRVAIAADDAFEAALKAEGHRRWTWIAGTGSKALNDAWRAKRHADAAMHKAFMGSYAARD